MKTKIMNLLAALALTAAALATPSAFGYGAISQATTSTFGYTVNIATNQEDANNAAINNCVDGDEVRRPGCAGNIRSFTNMCFGLFRDNDADQVALWVVLATTRALSEVEHGFCAFSGCVKIELSAADVCDHTCNAIQTDTRDADTAGCDTCPDNMIANADNSACVAVQNSTDCGTRADLLNTEERFLIGGVCSEAMDCSGDSDGVLDTETGLCKECTGQVEFNEQCLDSCTDNKDRFNNNPECVCADTQEQIDGEGDCVDKCVAPETRDDMDNCVDMTDNGGGDIDLTQMASDGLVDLAVSGSPGTLSDELDAADIEHTIIGRNDFTDGVGTTTPNSTVFITCPSGRAEYLAPRGIELANGTKYAMVEPFCYPDHFIVQFADGRAERWDVGHNEGHRLPFLVTVTTATSGDDGGGGNNDDDNGNNDDNNGGNNDDVNPPTVTVTVTTNQCDGIVFVDDGNGGCELNQVLCDGIVDGIRCVADTEQMNVVTVTATVTVTVTALPEGESAVNYNGELVTVTTAAGANEAFGVLSSGVQLRVVGEPANTMQPSVSSGGGGGGSAGLIIGGVVVGGILIYVLSGGTADDVFWSPQYAFEWHNGKSLYSYGSRWDYHKENLNVYWTAANNTAGDWQYGSGATWHGDILTASYDSIGDGTMADADLSLMAHKTIGNWALQSGIRSNIQIQESGTSTSHRVNAEAIFRRDDDWKVSTVIGRYDRYFSVYMLFTKKL